jgi:hypothetical protein
VAILQDLGGPKIRTGRLAGGKAIVLVPGETVTITTGDGAGGPGRLFTTFEGLARGVRPNDRLLLADGRIELRVDSTDGKEIDATVVDGGEIGEHKGINAPGVPLPTSAVTPKDVEDLDFGLSLGVDMVALSFVQTAADVQQARRIMDHAGADGMPLIAKLERPQALEHLEEILAACDAVMVARGDLGLEMALERVPRAQKEITRRARQAGKPVIVATQVLESMTVEARPTRAEVNEKYFKLCPEKFELMEGKMFWTDEERLNMLALLQAYVFEQPTKCRQILWMTGAGAVLGLTYLMRIDLGTFFTLITAGLIALYPFGLRETFARRLRLASVGAICTVVMFCATHAPFYLDAVKRGYSAAFVNQYTSWIGMVRGASSVIRLPWMDLSIGDAGTR